VPEVVLELVRVLQVEDVEVSHLRPMP
jgi:hypothetical protein